MRGSRIHPPTDARAIRSGNNNIVSLDYEQTAHHGRVTSGNSRSEEMEMVTERGPEVLLPQTASGASPQRITM